jgi:hypothetical protein
LQFLALRLQPQFLQDDWDVTGKSQAQRIFVAAFMRVWILFLILVGKSRCDFPVAERSVRRRNDGAVLWQAEELRRC